MNLNCLLVWWETWVMMMHDNVCVLTWLLACLAAFVKAWFLKGSRQHKGGARIQRTHTHFHSTMHGCPLPHEVLTSQRTSPMFDDFKIVFKLSVKSPKVGTKSPFFIFIFVTSHIHVGDLKRNSKDETPFASIMKL